MAFVIPTIYTAVDKFSAVASRISAASEGMSRKMEIHAARSQRAWNKFMPETDDALKRRFEFMLSMGKAMAVAGTALFSAKIIMDYEKELANLRALTGVTGSEFLQYKNIIETVAKETQTSSVDIAKAFTTIGNASPELLKSADALAVVTKAAVLMGRASNMEMGESANSLTSILNQFGKSAEYAATAVDILAAGSKYGSSEIKDLQESIKAFGKVADIGNITLKESVAITELVSKYKKGADAGVELRNVLLEMGKGFAQDDMALRDLQRLGVNIALVANKSVPFAARLKEISKIGGDSNAVLHVFGKENAAMAITLMQNSDKFALMNESLSETGVAMQMAKENTSTLVASFERFKAAWVNIIVSSKKAGFALGLVKGALGFLTNNMNGILNLAVPIIGFFTIWKGIIVAKMIAVKAATSAQIALNFVEGVGTVINKQYATACFASTAGMNGMAFASFFLETSLLSLSLGFAGVVIGVALLVNEFKNGYDSNIQYVDSLKKTKDGIYELSKPLSEGQIRIQEYNKAMEEFHKLQNYEAFYKRASTFQQIIEPVSSPIMFAKYNAATMHRQIPLTAPALSDYDLNSSGQYTPNTGTTNTQVIHHKVDIMQNGNVIGSFDTSAAMPSIGSTTN